MIEFLKNIDCQILLFINGYHNSFADALMWFISGKIFLIPILLITVFGVWKNFGWKSVIAIVISALIVIILTDQISVHVFKNVFLRYRPSHNLEIGPLLHFYEHKPGELYKGGQYGFISSHAANYFGFFGLVASLFYKKNKALFAFLLCIGLLIGISRVYLGVHYPSDVAVGGIVGFTIGLSLYLSLTKRFLHPTKII